MHKQKHYYVDCENVADSWVGVLKKARKGDTIYLYVSKHIRLGYPALKILVKSKSKCRIKVREGIVSGKGDSALDYFLLGELNNRLAKEPDTKFIVVSNDKGYDPFLREMGRIHDRKIVRMGMDIKEKRLRKPSKEEGNCQMAIFSEKPEESTVPCGAGTPVIPVKKDTVTEVMEAMRQIAMKNAKGRPLNKVDFRKMAEIFVSTSGNWMQTFGVMKNPKDVHMIADCIPKNTRAGITKLLCLN